MNDEFPHIVEIFHVTEGNEDDSGGFTEGGPKTLFSMNCFVDTPSSDEQYKAMQLESSFDRYLFYPYEYKLLNKHFVRFDGDEYELVGKPMDQGGANEIYRVKLREVSHEHYKVREQGA